VQIQTNANLAVTYRAPEEIKPHHQNSRAHTKSQIEMVAKSIENYGWTNPILIDDDDNVIAGHARLEAAKLLKIAIVPTICLSHMTPAQKRAYIIADMRKSALAFQHAPENSNLPGNAIQARSQHLQGSWPIPRILLPDRLPTQRGSMRVLRACPQHRAWVRRHQCSVLGCKRTPIECAHVRSGTNGGIALKPSDRWCISLCTLHHAEQHRIGELAFATRHDLDLAALAARFALCSPHRHKLDALR